VNIAHAARLLAVRFLSYRFSDGMIHDSLVPRLRRGVAHK